MNPAEPTTGVTLVRKLSIKSGQVVALVSAPTDFVIPELPDDVTVRKVDKPDASAVSGADVLLFFLTEAADLRAGAPPLLEGLQTSAALWIAWPRRAGGHVSDVTDEIIRETLLPSGVVDVKVAALTADWSGLRFVWRRARRPSV